MERAEAENAEIDGDDEEEEEEGMKFDAGDDNEDDGVGSGAEDVKTDEK